MEWKWERFVTMGLRDEAKRVSIQRGAFNLPGRWKEYPERLSMNSLMENEFRNKRLNVFGFFDLLFDQIAT
jgi:hypothetical protein